jgi:hypothetical protein
MAGCSPERDWLLEVQYDLEWEVQNFLATYFAKGQELGKLLIITGGSTDAQAQNCRNYLVQAWPDIDHILLDKLQEVLSLGSEGKCIRNYSLVEKFADSKQKLF